MPAEALLVFILSLIRNPQVAYLENEIGIPRNRIKRIITALPSLLSYSVEGGLKPKASN